MNLPHTLYSLLLRGIPLVLLFPLSLFSQAEGEGYAESYLQRNIGARAIGMAGAYTAAVNEPNAIFLNPGALSSQLPTPVISSMYSMLGFGRYHTTLSYAQTFEDGFGAGVGINNYYAGSFTRRDARGNNLGIATNQLYSFSVGAAYNIVGSAAFGIAGKYLVNSLGAENLQGDGFAFDAGTKFPFLNLFTVGVAVQNIGFIQWNNRTSTRETLPWMLRAGFSTEIPLSQEEIITRSASLGEEDTLSLPPTRSVIISLEGMYVRGSASPLITLGTEYTPADLFSIRAGFTLVGDDYGSAKFLPMSTYSAGISYRVEASELPFQLQIDYAASHDYTTSGGISHHFSLTCGF